MKKKPSPQERFNAVRDYFQGRQIRQYMPVMSAVDKRLSVHSSDIQMAWNYRLKMREEHLPMISLMEKVVEHLKAA